MVGRSRTRYSNGTRRCSGTRQRVSASRQPLGLSRQSSRAGQQVFVEAVEFSVGCELEVVAAGGVDGRDFADGCFGNRYVTRPVTVKTKSVVILVGYKIPRKRECRTACDCPDAVITVYRAKI